MPLGFLNLLTLALIVLKLTGFIAWPWGSVFLPFYIGLCLLVAMLLGAYFLTRWKKNSV